MKKAGRRFHRIFRAVFAAALALAITGANLAPAAAVTWADVNELKDEANGLDAEKKELQAKLDALADDKSQAVARKELLDQQIANTEAQIANTQAQIDRYAALITQTEAELVEAEEKEAAQYELFCSRVREMEKQDEVSYWAVLFRASSFTDLLGRLDAINEIMKYDQGVIDDLKALQAENVTLSARYEQVFDMERIQAAVGDTMVRPTEEQIVYLDLSEPDSVVLYGEEETASGIQGALQGFKNIVHELTEYFR